MAHIHPSLPTPHSGHAGRLSSTPLGLALELDLLQHLQLTLPDAYSLFHSVDWMRPTDSGTARGEIDIVARDGPTIVFVEVKARTSERFGGGAAAITPMKQRRIAHMASDFLARHRLDGQPCRFDVVVVDVAAHDVRVEVIRDAFGAG